LMIKGKKPTKKLIMWDKNDPTSEWECIRDKRIKEIQGNSNPYLKCD